MKTVVLYVTFILVGAPALAHPQEYVQTVQIIGNHSKDSNYYRDPANPDLIVQATMDPDNFIFTDTDNNRYMVNCLPHLRTGIFNRSALSLTQIKPFGKVPYPGAPKEREYHFSLQFSNHSTCVEGMKRFLKASENSPLTLRLSDGKFDFVDQQFGQNADQQCPQIHAKTMSLQHINVPIPNQ